VRVNVGTLERWNVGTLKRWNVEKMKLVRHFLMVNLMRFCKSDVLKSFTHRRWFWPLVASLPLLMLFICSKSKESTSYKPSWTQVEKGDLSIDAVENGEIRAVHSVDIKAPMEWRMELQIVDMVPEGTIVRPGDFLVQFDTSELMKRLEIAQDNLTSLLAQRDRLLAEQSARLSQLQSDVASAQFSQDIADLQKELLKYEAEVKRQDAELESRKAGIQKEEAETSLESQTIIDQSALSELKVELGKAKMEVKELQDKINSMRLTAPIGGMAVYNEVGWWNNQKKAAKGDKVNPGEAVISIPNLNEMQVNLRVNEMDAARLRTGYPAVIILDAYADRKFTGQVIQIAKLAQKENWESVIKDFEVIVRIDQSDEILKPGMTARAVLTLDVLPGTLYVPLAAVFEKDGKPVVYPRKGYPEPQPVEIAARTDQFAAIRSLELHENDEIAWRPPQQTYERLGYAEAQARRRNTASVMTKAFAEMDKRGLTYDYEGNRGRRVIAQSGQGDLPPDVEALRAQFKVMSQDGKPVEINPDMMKKLQQAMRGRQPGMAGPGSPPAAGRLLIRSADSLADTTRRMAAPALIKQDRSAAPADSSTGPLRIMVRKGESK